MASLQKIQQHLERIGLTEKESILYGAGLQIGPATIQELSDVSQLKRTTVYDTLESLHAKNLVKIIAKGKKQKLYSMSEPKELASYIQQKENALETIYKDLELLQKTARKRPKVTIYQGVEGMKEIYSDLLAKNDNHLEMLSCKMPDERVWDYWMRGHAERRVKKGMHIRMITPDLPVYREMQKQDKHLLRETRIIPKGRLLPIENEVFAYNQKVAFVTQEGDDSLGLVVQSPDIYKTVNAMLEYIWNSLNS